MEKRHNFHEVYFYCNYYYITRLGVQLGHVQALFLYTLPLIPTVHLLGQMLEPPFYWENWGSGGEKLISNFTTTKWESQAQAFLNGLLSSPTYPLQQEDTELQCCTDGCGFPRWPFNKRRGCKWAKVCWEFLSVRNAYIATHIQEMSGLGKHLFFFFF